MPLLHVSMQHRAKKLLVCVCTYAHTCHDLSMPTATQLASNCCLKATAPIVSRSCMIRAEKVNLMEMTSLPMLQLVKCSDFDIDAVRPSWIRGFSLRHRFIICGLLTLKNSIVAKRKSYLKISKARAYQWRWCDV